STICVRSASAPSPAPPRSSGDDFSSNRHLALIYCWSMIPRVEPEGMLFRKPASTPDQVRGRLFRDHALAPVRADRPPRLSRCTGDIAIYGCDIARGGLGFHLAKFFG